MLMFWYKKCKILISDICKNILLLNLTCIWVQALCATWRSTYGCSQLLRPWHRPRDWSQVCWTLAAGLTARQVHHSRQSHLSQFFVFASATAAASGWPLHPAWYGPRVWCGLTIRGACYGSINASRRGWYWSGGE